MNDLRKDKIVKQQFALVLPIALALLVAPMPSSAETLTCTPTKKFICSSQGCKTVPAKVRVLINIDKHSYSRCDSFGCDNYNANVSIGGIYLYVSVTDKSLAAKIEIPSLQYFETISSGLAVYTSFGRCIRK